MAAEELSEYDKFQMRRELRGYMLMIGGILLLVACVVVPFMCWLNWRDNRVAQHWTQFIHTHNCHEVLNTDNVIAVIHDGTVERIGQTPKAQKSRRGGLSLRR